MKLQKRPCLELTRTQHNNVAVGTIPNFESCSPRGISGCLAVGPVGYQNSTNSNTY